MKQQGEGGLKERRSLIEGLKPATSVDRTLEAQFVYEAKAPKAADTAPSQAPPAASEMREGKGQGSNAVGRAPLTTRIRSDFAASLKRASLQRQLDGVFPHTLQDILEEALEPWLRSNGYLN